MDKHDRKQNQKVNTEEQQAIIDGLKDRLIWLTYEASDEECNEREVQAIVNLLNELDPIDIDRTKYNPQLGMKRLRERCEKTNSGGVVDEVSHKKDKFAFFHRSRGMVGVAATVFVVCLIFWGNSNPTMADLDTGFFHWLKMGETGQEVVIFPTQELIQADQAYKQLQYSDEELPQHYKNEMWIPETIGENWDLELNNVILGDLCTILNRDYYNASLDKNILIQVMIYENHLMFERKCYADFTYLYEKEVAGTTMFYFEKQGKDEIEHAISFYEGTRCYSVQGDTSVKKIEEVVTDYADAILGNLK